jgi:hypothetical protein
MSGLQEESAAGCLEAIAQVESYDHKLREMESTLKDGETKRSTEGVRELEEHKGKATKWWTDEERYCDRPKSEGIASVGLVGP